MIFMQLLNNFSLSLSLSLSLLCSSPFSAESDKPQSAGRGRGGRQDNRRNQGPPGEEREFFPRGEGRGRGGRGGRPRLSSRDKVTETAILLETLFVGSAVAQVCFTTIM